MQRRGEKNLEKPQKWKKIRLKLLKCEKAENKFKILARSQKVSHSSRISHYIMVAEVKKPKKATWLKKVKAEKLNVLSSSSSRNSITWPRRCAGGKNMGMKWASQCSTFTSVLLNYFSSLFQPKQKQRSTLADGEGVTRLSTINFTTKQIVNRLLFLTFPLGF